LKVNEKTHLDLFSGIGGFALAARWNGYRTVGFCDNEPYAQAVLKKHWPDVPCHKDIREVRGELYAGVTLLTGGFPCQPFSVAGKQGGKDDDRYLWPEMLRVIREARPTWIIGENVAGIVNMALDQVHTDLEAEGYEVESIIIPACAVDAPHRRNRVWIVGHSKLDGLTATKTGGGLFDQSEEQRGKIEERESSGTSCASSDVADTFSLSEGSAHRSEERECERGRQEQDISQRNEVGSNPSDCGEDVANAVSQRGCSGNSEGGYAEDVGQSSRHSRDNSRGMATWLPEPNVGRVAHGVPNRVAKLRGLGNAIVPQVASEIIRCINQVMEDNK
jgi:DNA (cytosine-5)-methyltransferase 1